jgi:hypothetical protein
MAMSSSAAFGPRREANMTFTEPLSRGERMLAGTARSQVDRLPSNTTVTASPPRSANASSSSTSARIAPGRSRHHPFGRDPITFMPSTIQRLIGAAG